MHKWKVSWDFSAPLVHRAPDSPGVYVLSLDDEVVYYGHAGGGDATIRSRLMDHLEGREPLCGCRITKCRWEACPDPMRRHSELLREHSRLFGRLPCCNEPWQEERRQQGHCPAGAQS
jgi:hypothetical protein